MEIPPSPTESVRNKIDELLAEVRERIDVMDFHEKRNSFAEKIRKSYPKDYEKYRCYHQLIGSHFPKEYNVGDIVEGDFEGDCSVVSFLEELLSLEKSKNIAG